MRKLGTNQVPTSLPNFDEYAKKNLRTPHPYRRTMPSNTAKIHDTPQFARGRGEVVWVSIDKWIIFEAEQ